jgi:hypothetical protein
VKLKHYTVLCASTGHVLGHVLAYNETDAKRSAAAYGWTINIKVRAT